MRGPKVLKIVPGIIMFVTLLLSLATTTTSATATAPTPALTAAPTSPSPPPVCDGEVTPAITLAQDEEVVKNFTDFIVKTNVEKLVNGTYNPLLHGRLIDCGCGKIIDTRSPGEMEAAILKFCQGKEFVSVFEAYVLYLIQLATESQGGSQHQLPPSPPSGAFLNSIPSSSVTYTDLVDSQIASFESSIESMGNIG